MFLINAIIEAFIMLSSIIGRISTLRSDLIIALFISFSTSKNSFNIFLLFYFLVLLFIMFISFIQRVGNLGKTLIFMTACIIILFIISCIILPYSDDK